MSSIIPASVNPGQNPNEAHPAASDYGQIGDIKILGANGVWHSLPIGNDAQVLTADHTQPLGLKWA